MCLDSDGQQFYQYPQNEQWPLTWPHSTYDKTTTYDVGNGLVCHIYFVFFLPGFRRVRVTRFLVLCVCFVERCLFFCSFPFGHCVVCSSSIYGFWLPLWYLQTLLNTKCMFIFLLRVRFPHQMMYVNFPVKGTIPPPDDVC